MTISRMLQGCLVAGVMVSGAAAKAQDPGASRTLHHRLHHVAAPERRVVGGGLQPLTERRLTIQRRSRGYAPDAAPDDDVFLDGNVRYNSIRTFDPAPYATSGRQFPFGLDGIGGYGSDLGFGAGSDDALYDRGP